MAQKKKSGWGGKRTAGKDKTLGRPRKFKDAQKVRSILITDELYNYAKEIGKNASEGIRLALEFHRAMRHQFVASQREATSAPPGDSANERSPST